MRRRKGWKEGGRKGWKEGGGRNRKREGGREEERDGKKEGGRRLEIMIATEIIVLNTFPLIQASYQCC